LGPGPVADLLTVVEHRRVVLLTLPDHHHTPHRDGVDQPAHGVDGGLVSALLVAAPDPPAGGHGGRLGDPDEVQRKVAVEVLRLGGRPGHRDTASYSGTVRRRPGRWPYAGRPDRACLMASCHMCRTLRRLTARRPGPAAVPAT